MNITTQDQLKRLHAPTALELAAPDMLAALISVDKQIEALIGEENWYSSNQAANLCREVRAAIAKATGAGKGKTIAPPTPQQPTAESTAYELPCSL